MNHNQEATRFDRIKIIVGQDGLQNLTDATVMILGLGGVGSSCVEALARGGVGRLIVIDSDIVEITNINRQAIAFESTIGRPKADVMTAKIHQINPDCHVIAEQVEISPENCAEVIVATLVGVLYFKESLNYVSLIGIAIMLASIVLMNIQPSSSKPAL